MVFMVFLSSVGGPHHCDPIRLHPCAPALLPRGVREAHWILPTGGRLLHRTIHILGMGTPHVKGFLVRCTKSQSWSG